MGNAYPFATANFSPGMAEAAFAVFSGIMLFFLIFGAAAYIYGAICFFKIARKTGTSGAWMAWIPILNIILILKVAGKSFWWIILFFIPLVNIIIAIIVWMAVAKRCGKPAWLGIIMLLPVVNYVIIGYLAFSSANVPAVQVNPIQPAVPPVPEPPAIMPQAPEPTPVTSAPPAPNPPADKSNGPFA